jgi:ribosomal protein S18 acetylase RimI-like enzyme
MNIIFRQYSRSDNTDEIFYIHDEALRAIGCVPLDRKLNNDLNDIMGNYILNGGDFIMVETGSKLIGFGALNYIGNGIYEIKRMRIMPNWQGKGLGKTLLKRLTEIAIKRNAIKIILDTTVQQIAAQRLYEGFGFKKCGMTTIHGLEVILYEYDIDLSKGLQI